MDEKKWHKLVFAFPGYTPCNFSINGDIVTVLFREHTYPPSAASSASSSAPESPLEDEYNSIACLFNPEDNEYCYQMGKLDV